MPQPLADIPQYVMYFQSEYNNRIGVICNNIIIYCIVLLQIWHIEILVVFVGVVGFSNSKYPDVHVKLETYMENDKADNSCF